MMKTVIQTTSVLIIFHFLMGKENLSISLKTVPYGVIVGVLGYNSRQVHSAKMIAWTWKRVKGKF